MISRRDLLLSFTASPLLLAQDTTISTDVNVVNVFVTVRNKQGQVVRDLTKDDFSLDEERRPQVIKYFSKESDLPLTLGLVVDTSASQRRVLEPERTASYQFLDQVLREDKDQAFLIHFDSEVELLQDLTNSRKQLQKALRQLDVAPARQLQRRGQDPGQYHPRGGTSLYDAVLLSADELMKKQTGRKAVIVLSDGVDNASKVTVTDAIESAEKSDTLVYAILFSDEQAYGAPVSGVFGGGRGMHGRNRGQEQRPDGRKIMEKMARETGGGFFEAGKKQTIDQTFNQIQEELRSQYSLGYTPDKNTGPGYRAIHVTTKQKNLIVQARDGYYPAK
jgi:VWFA-related protein